MASIVQKFKKFYVSYTLPKEIGREFCERNGISSEGKRQIWELFPTKETAEKRKQVVEAQLEEIKLSKGLINHLSVIRPIKLWDFVEEEFIPTKAKKWQPKTYSLNMSLLRNHVKPHLGDKLIQAVTQEDILRLYETLKHTPKGAYKEGNCLLSKKQMADHHSRDKYLGPTTIHQVTLLLGSVFRMAKKRKIITEDPMPEEIPVKRDEVKIPIWDDTLMKNALDNMRDDPVLCLAVHLAYVGALRNGETVGITLEELDMKNDRIYITKTLQRVSKVSLQQASREDVLFEFPTAQSEKESCIVLKKPKTVTSVRELLLTEPLKREIEARLKQIKLDKCQLGERYHDYGLLLCLENGDPIEPRLLMKWFSQWQKKQFTEKGEEYPTLKFHGIRHSSATYYVEHCEGDFKSVQAVTGHKSLEVLLKIYAHATTSARRRLLETFQNKFYSGKSPSLGETFSHPQERENDVIVTLITLAKGSKEIKELLLKMCKENPRLQETILTALLAG